MVGMIPDLRAISFIFSPFSVCLVVVLLHIGVCVCVFVQVSSSPDLLKDFLIFKIIDVKFLNAFVFVEL